MDVTTVHTVGPDDIIGEHGQHAVYVPRVEAIVDPFKEFDVIVHWGLSMPRRAYFIFGDIEGRLDVLRVDCTKCARKGRYSVRRLIEKHGRKANMMKWMEQLNGDCPRRDAHSLHERCNLICPDLPKVL
jgi:hypothetical protein